MVPTISLSSAVVTGSSVAVSWSIPAWVVVDVYEVTWAINCRETIEYADRIAGSSTNYTLCGLEHYATCSDITFTITASNSGGSGEASLNVVIQSLRRSDDEEEESRRDSSDSSDYDSSDSSDYDSSDSSDYDSSDSSDYDSSDSSDYDSSDSSYSSEEGTVDHTPNYNTFCTATVNHNESNNSIFDSTMCSGTDLVNNIPVIAGALGAIFVSAVLGVIVGAISTCAYLRCTRKE